MFLNVGKELIAVMTCRYWMQTAVICILFLDGMHGIFQFDKLIKNILMIGADFTYI